MTFQPRIRAVQSLPTLTPLVSLASGGFSTGTTSQAPMIRQDGLLGRQSLLPEAARLPSHAAQPRHSQQHCRARHATPRQSVNSSMDPAALQQQLRQQAQDLSSQSSPLQSSPVDGRRAESIIERTATHGNMSEADVISRLQVTISATLCLPLPSTARGLTPCSNRCGM